VEELGEGRAEHSVEAGRRGWKEPRSSEVIAEQDVAKIKNRETEEVEITFRTGSWRWRPA
jgi:hypothetical protein